MLQWLKAEGHSVTLRAGVIVVELSKPTKADEQAQVQAQALDVLAVALAAWYGLPGRLGAISARWSARVVRHKLDG